MMSTILKIRTSYFFCFDTTKQKTQQYTPRFYFDFMIWSWIFLHKNLEQTL